MKVLTVDKGNTNCKFALFKDGEIVECGVENSIDGLEALIKKFGPDWTSFSSVVPDWSDKIKMILNLLGFPYKELSSQVKLPFKLLVDEPQRVGPDRIALACGARHLGFDRAVIVDAGTALTVDLLSNVGFEGGAIFPGPELLIKALSSGTAMIGDIEISDSIPELPGRNTRDAVVAGIFRGFIGAVNSLILQTMERFDSRSLRGKEMILITGGYSDWVMDHLAPEIEKISRLEKNLVFYGLYSILEIDD